MSSAASLASSTSCISSSSEVSVDGYSCSRDYQEEGSSGSSQDESSFSLRERPRVNGVHPSDVVVKNMIDGGINVYDGSGVIGTERIVGNGLPINGENGKTDSCKGEMDLEFWLPPETEDHVNDMEGSVVNYDDDDDDECGDGTKWGKPSSLSSFEEQDSGYYYKYKEEKQKAMDEVRNCKFKSILGHLLKSSGVAPSGKDGENWEDIVTSLSWEAATFVKPETGDGKAMDPTGYVKVKCVATGSPSQSQVFKGMVFKKHAAHKHMPTNFKNPRLLLIQGALDLSLDGLSSFESMKQEKDIVKSIIEPIEMCHPNVVLVEKTVSRDIQESLLAKGMTLVYDMKLHRLQRVARCTGSSILSSDTLTGTKLRQCYSFHFEKFVEENAAVGESGRRPSNTLMFIKGCPTRLGCTILLKGTNSDELKKIKRLVQYAVLLAYHLILETAFLLDQRVMFSTLPVDGTIDIHISSGIHEEGIPNLGQDGGILLPYEPYNPVDFSRFSSISTSQKRALEFSFRLLSASHQSVSTYFASNREVPNNLSQLTNEVSMSPESNDHSDMEEKDFKNDGTLIYRKAPSDSQNSAGDSEGQGQFRDEGTGTVVDAVSILVLMSRRNSSTGTICEQSHFSHIKFYREFDVPLGLFLRDNLLNQKLVCNFCGGLPEAHSYYYAHSNKQLTIQVRRLPLEKCLPGESEGKLWMWGRCANCKPKNGKAKSTKRVLISATACGLSLGKFLELSLSNDSSCSRSCSCGHQFHSDFLYFFGLGPMVAMLRYSPVTTYSVSLPPEKLKFADSIRGEHRRKEFENVSKMYEKGIEIFLEVEKSLKEIRSHFLGLKLSILGSLKVFSDIEEMLKQEKQQFEDDIQNILQNWNSGDAVYKLLSLNRVRWDILIESCVWDRRLHSLLSSEFTTTNITTSNNLNQEEDSAVKEEEADGVIKCEEFFDNGDDLDKKLETNDCPIIEVPIEGDVQESTERDNLSTSATVMTNRSYNKEFFHCGEENIEGDILDLNSSQRNNKASVVLISNQEHPEGWIWNPFPVIRQQYMRDIQKGYTLKFEPLSNIHAKGSQVHDMITEKGSRLHIPLGIDNCILSDYEDELSSIIACALALLKDPSNVIEDLNEDISQEYESSRCVSRPSSSTPSNWSSFGSLSSLDGKYSSTSLSSEESGLATINGLTLSDSLVSFLDPHPEVSMGLRKFPGKGKYSVISLYASQFQELRKRCCPSELDYIASLSRCVDWNAKGGKSKSFFAKTLDDRFIIKEIKRTEYESFMKFAPEYFKYMKECFELGNQTCLAKILGIHQVIVRQKGGKEMKHDLMVMENLTFGRSIIRQYDLKGALHSRLNSAPNGSGDVLLDQNFVNDMKDSPFYVSRTAKRNLQRAVWNDTKFLYNINVMDYSLLVGVDAQNRELVCGIIDYLRQYTWDKQVENWVKASLVVPKNQLPTVISPREYKKRFRNFITTHFSTVPDHWGVQMSTNPSDDEDFSHGKSQGQEDKDS